MSYLLDRSQSLADGKPCLTPWVNQKLLLRRTTKMFLSQSISTVLLCIWNWAWGSTPPRNKWSEVSGSLFLIFGCLSRGDISHQLWANFSFKHSKGHDVHAVSLGDALSLQEKVYREASKQPSLSPWSTTEVAWEKLIQKQISVLQSNILSLIN